MSVLVSVRTDKSGSGEHRGLSTAASVYKENLKIGLLRCHSKMLLKPHASSCQSTKNNPIFLCALSASSAIGFDFDSVVLI